MTEPNEDSLPPAPKGSAPMFRIPRVAASPLELRLLGRMLLHAAVVGVAAGIAGSLFFAALEFVQVLVLEHLVGYRPLLAAGEELIQPAERITRFRPWLVWIVPALGALAAGIVSHRFAPETLGGGSDAIIDAFHNRAGIVRRRVPLIKGIVSIFTLGFGGSGGREGPTMLIGGGIGSIIGRYLRVTERERRILLVAGTAAGMAAVFRTPLGAALLAVEVLHRDDFESDALVPAVLSSVVSYSVFISFFGESTLFAHAARYPFVLAHLPLYAVMAILVSLIAAGFAELLHGMQRRFARSRLPPWVRPATGGLLLGIVVTPLLYLVGPHVGPEGQGLGVLGGGYGAAQVAITGATWFPGGWRGVELLVALGLVKILATSLTVGSGGSAGDFGPSLVIGGLFGGAFGRAASLLIADPRIDPGAFALVGMATFYGGLAHVPIASLVMTCELAGSYDLLVPLMLAEGIAFVALRKRSLYLAQVETKRESPAHRDDLVLDVLRGIRVADILRRDQPFITFARKTSASEIVARMSESAEQDVFPVLSDTGELAGMVDAKVLRTIAANPDLFDLALADDMMSPAAAVRESDDLHLALEVLLAHDTRELIVLDEAGAIVGFVDEAEITRSYHQRTVATTLQRGVSLFSLPRVPPPSPRDDGPS